MRIIISPAKQMIVDTDNYHIEERPVFVDKAEEIMGFMKSLSYEEAKKLWACNDKLAQQNFERFADMDLSRNLTPAILAYDGIAYKYMGPSVFQYGEFDYVQEHLRILSGFYGVLKPLDGVVAYRLEMQAKAQIAGTKNLYDYWGSLLYKEVVLDSKEEADQHHVVINLASKEYSKCIEKYLTPEDTYITCIFGELDAKGKVVQKGVYAKMARGEMVRYMAQHHVQTPEEIKGFDHLGYRYDAERSDEKTYVFLMGK